MEYENLIPFFDTYSTEAGVANSKTLFTKIQESTAAQKILSMGKDVLPYIGEYLRYTEHPSLEITKAFKNAWMALMNRIAEDNKIEGEPPFLSDINLWIHWLTSAPMMSYEPIDLFAE